MFFLSEFVSESSDCDIHVLVDSDIAPPFQSAGHADFCANKGGCWLSCLVSSIRQTTAIDGVSFYYIRDNFSGLDIFQKKKTGDTEKWREDTGRPLALQIIRTRKIAHTNEQNKIIFTKGVEGFWAEKPIAATMRQTITANDNLHTARLGSGFPNKRENGGVGLTLLSK